MTVRYPTTIKKRNSMLTDGVIISKCGQPLLDLHKGIFIEKNNSDY